MIELIALAATWILMAIFGAIVANEKGHDGGPWALGCLFLGPIVFLATIGLPDKRLWKLLEQRDER